MSCENERKRLLPRPRQFQSSGPVVFWSSGPLNPRSFASVVLSSSVPVNLWFSGAMVLDYASLRNLRLSQCLVFLVYNILQDFLAAFVGRIGVVASSAAAKDRRQDSSNLEEWAFALFI